MYDERTIAKNRMVCLGMDCLRIAMGMDPINYDVEMVERMILSRIKDLKQARANYFPTCAEEVIHDW